MKTTKDRIRRFEKTDELLLEQAQVMCDNFKKDKAVFIAAVPMFADPFEGDFQTVIVTTEAIPYDTEITAEIELATENLNKEMNVGRKVYMELIYFVKLAYPNSDAHQSIFGHNKYDKVRNIQTGLINLIEQAHRKAEDLKYKNELLASGYTQTKIDNLQTVYTSLHDLNQEQEGTISERALRTKERVQAVNNVWGYMEKVSEASKLIYVDNPTKTEQYLLYPEGRSKQNDTNDDE